MAPSARSLPFCFKFEPVHNGEFTTGESSGSGAPPKQATTIPINGFVPVKIENDFFSGHMLLVHDTGNEPGLDQAQGAEDHERRGVEFQIQGMFKKPILTSDITKSGLWLCGELPEPMKFGFITRSIVALMMACANRRTNGRAYYHPGDKNELPHLGLPIVNVFTVIKTPPGEEPPKLGSDELSKVKWPGPSPVDFDDTSVFTLYHKTPYADLCTWELLNIPGVTPLGAEKIIGDITTCKLMFYDLGKAGSHQDMKKALIMEFSVVRGKDGSIQTPDTESSAGNDTPPVLEQVSESDDSQADEDDMEDEDDLEVADHVSSSSSSSEDLEDEEMILEDDLIQEVTFSELDAWRPTASTVECLDSGSPVEVPFYIEAVDRRRKKRVRVWYVFNVRQFNGASEWYHAKWLPELQKLCRAQPRMRSFRRGAARGCLTCPQLEQFRQATTWALSGPPDTRLRRALILAATSGMKSTGGLHRDISAMPEQSQKLMLRVQSTLQDFAQEIKEEGLAKTARREINKRKSNSRKKSKPLGPLLPPRFFELGSRACELAFKGATEGMGQTVREALVGAIHFEGRVCEELLRLSKDGTLRCFSPYDCDRPRLTLHQSHVSSVEPIDGLFLGRFHCWEIAFELRVFVFCSTTCEEREEWIAALIPKEARWSRSMTPGHTEVSHRVSESSQAEVGPELSETRDRLAAARDRIDVARMPTFRQKSLLQAIPAETLLLLTDTTRARRWRPKTRLILNDRRLLIRNGATPLPPLTVAEQILQRVLAFEEGVAGEALKEFMDLTCLLKAVQLGQWGAHERLAFWLNVYHCLLLHGRLILGTPKSRRELALFNNRVSYFVGSSPVSLREIECFIIRMPGTEKNLIRVPRKAKRFWRALCPCLALCPCNRKTDVLKDKKPASKAQQKANAVKADGGNRSRAESNTSQNSGGHISPGHRSDRSEGSSPTHRRDRGLDALEGLPRERSTSDHSHRETGVEKVWSKRSEEEVAELQKGGATCGVFGSARLAVPRPWQRRRWSPACLFIGRPSEANVDKLPLFDMRVTFALNRANMSSMQGIPIFSASRLDAQLTDVSKIFAKTFVEVQEVNGNTRVVLPHCCKFLKDMFISGPRNYQPMLRYVWDFMPSELPAPGKETRVVFSPYRAEPRERAQIIKLAYTNQDLEPSPLPTMPRPLVRLTSPPPVSDASDLQQTTPPPGVEKEQDGKAASRQHTPLTPVGNPDVVSL